jgi:hypothetical protein
MIYTNNNSFQKGAMKVFSQLGQFIEEDEKLNKNHVLLHKLPNDIIQKLCMNLLDKMINDLRKYSVKAKTLNY